MDFEIYMHKIAKGIFKDRTIFVKDTIRKDILDIYYTLNSDKILFKPEDELSYLKIRYYLEVLMCFVTNKHEKNRPLFKIRNVIACAKLVFSIKKYL